MKKKFALAIILIVTLAVSTVLPAYGINAKDTGTVVKLKPESNIIEINGRKYTAVSPIRDGNIIFVPLRLILEAFGAEVNWNGNGKVGIVYRDYSIDLTVDKNQYLVNQDAAWLSVPPRYKNSTVMISLDFIEKYFNLDVSIDEATGMVTMILVDDGALTDLSFLLGSINASRVGNSHFNWSIDVPRGSRLSYTSFNSRYLHLENEQREMGIEVYTDVNVEDSLEEYFEKISISPEDFFNGEITDCILESEGNLEYIEVLYINRYDEAVIQRIYKSGRYIYNVALTSYSETEPEILGNNKYYRNLLDSFRMDYKGGGKDIQDLSKVEFGLVKYENYVNCDNSKKYLSWEMKVLPEWDVIKGQADNPYVTQLGMSEKEYIAVEINKLNDNIEFDEFISKIDSVYKNNFNPQYYEFIKKETLSIGERKTYKIVYKLDIGKSTYVVDDNFIFAGDLLYNITIKSPEDKYMEQKAAYYKMMESFRLSLKDQKNLKDSLKKYKYSVNRSRIGKSDEPCQYINDKYKWELKLPGYWVKSNSYNSNADIFYNDRSGASILVETVENEPDAKTKDDRDKFTYFGEMLSQDMELVKEENMSFRGYNGKSYSYKLENEEEELYMVFHVHIIDVGKISYCYISTIPDICASEMNLKELQEIWDSFAPSNDKVSSVY